MLTSDPNSKARRDLIEVPETSSALPMDLVRALGWLRGHLSEPIQLEQLGQVGGVRARTLQTHFKIKERPCRRVRLGRCHRGP